MILRTLNCYSGYSAFEPQQKAVWYELYVMTSVRVEHII